MSIWTLAQSTPRNFQGVFIWSAILIVLVLVAFAGYTYLRKWMQADEAPSSAARGFTLADLRDLHRQGKMTDAEYEATKAQLVGAAKKMVDTLPPVLPRTPTRRPPSDPAPPSPGA